MRRIKLRSLLCVASVSVLLFEGVEVRAQNSREIELTAQAILARVDRTMQYPDGRARGRIRHIRPEGSSSSVDFSISVSGLNSLFKFTGGGRGEQLKVLYTLGGEDIRVYAPHSRMTYHKMAIDRYDEVLGTNFNFIDISGYDLQSNYTASIEGEASIGGRRAYRLKLVPVFRSGLYGMLTLYVSKEDFFPMRIDFHDRDNAIFKFMTVAKTAQLGGRTLPVRYDMMNIRRGTVSIMSFYGFDTDVSFKSEIFRPERLGD